MDLGRAGVSRLALGSAGPQLVGLPGPGAQWIWGALGSAGSRWGQQGLSSSGSQVRELDGFGACWGQHDQPRAKRSPTFSACHASPDSSGSQLREPNGSPQISSVPDVLAGDGLTENVGDTRNLRLFVGLPAPGPQRIAGKSRDGICRRPSCLWLHASSLLLFVCLLACWLALARIHTVLSIEFVGCTCSHDVDLQ